MTAGSPYLLLTSALLFMLIAWDVFGGGLSPPLRSFYLLPHYVDWPVHAWVKVGQAQPHPSSPPSCSNQSHTMQWHPASSLVHAQAPCGLL